MVGRQGINKARPGTLAAQTRQHVGQHIDAHALLVERHPDQLGPQPLVRANRPRIRQFLGNDHVPRPFHQRLGHQRNRLHGAVHQRDVIGRHVDTLALGFAHGHDLAQALMAHVAGIVHQRRAQLAHGFTSRLGQRLRRERAGIRASTAKIVFAHNILLLEFQSLESGVLSKPRYPSPLGHGSAFYFLDVRGKINRRGPADRTADPKGVHRSPCCPEIADALDVQAAGDRDLLHGYARLGRAARAPPRPTQP